MKILMLSSTFPYPPSRGGTQVRTFNLLKYLARSHRVTLVTQRREDVTDDEVEALRCCVNQLAIFPGPEKSSSTKGKMGALPRAGINVLGKAQRFGNFVLEGTPPSVRYLYSLGMQEWIDNYIEAGNCEAITSEHSVNEIYVRPLWRQKLKTLINIHSSVYGTCRQQLQSGTSSNPLRDRLQLRLLRQYEQRYCTKFSGLVTTTEEDRRQLLEFNPRARIVVIPNGVDFDHFPQREADPGGHQIVFIGAMDNLPNIDAARFFSQEVFPLLKLRYPDATLTVAGARPVPEILELQKRPGIEVTGTVPSLVEYLHRATVCVVPMRTGYGIKNKTLQAMAAGVPVVASDRGLEGLAVDGEGVPLRALRANRLEECVRAVSRLFEDRLLRRELSSNGRSFVETEYTWEAAGFRYEQVLSELPVG